MEPFALVPVTNTSIFVLKLIPDLDVNLFSMLSRFQHVILEGYGSGGIPVDLEDALEQLIEQGTRVYITTQCLSGRFRFNQIYGWLPCTKTRCHFFGKPYAGGREIAAIQCGEL